MASSRWESKTGLAVCSHYQAWSTRRVAVTLSSLAMRTGSNDLVACDDVTEAVSDWSPVPGLRHRSGAVSSAKPTLKISSTWRELNRCEAATGAHCGDGDRPNFKYLEVSQSV